MAYKSTLSYLQSRVDVFQYLLECNKASAQAEQLGFERLVRRRKTGRIALLGLVALRQHRTQAIAQGIEPQLDLAQSVSRVLEACIHPALRCWRN